MKLMSRFLALCIVLFVSAPLYSQYGPNDDFDNDGISNLLDLDDDNDGILDTDEGCVNIATNEFSGTFGTISGTGTRNLQNPPGVGYTYATQNTAAGQYAVITKSTRPTWHPNATLFAFAGHTTGKADDAYLAVNGSTVVGTFYRETLTLTAGMACTYSIWHSAAYGPGDTYSLEIRVYAPGNNTTPIATAQTGVVSTVGWRSLSLGFTPPATGDYTIQLVNTSTWAGGNDFAIDDISFVTGCNRDTDSDGIPDQFDTDSDNDGCPDAIEGGLNFTAVNLDVNGRLTGGVDVNGIPVIAPSGQEPGAAYDAGISSCDPIAYPVLKTVTGMPAVTNLGDKPFQGSENGGAQQSWAGRSVTITDLPTNGFILYYNSVAITAPFEISNYTPAALQIQPGPGTPAGTDTTSFTYAVTGGSGIPPRRSDSVAYIVKYSLASLPAVFGPVSAVFKNNELIVSWTTETETNNDHFEIEASADGKKFTTIGTVNTQAENGTAVQTLHYRFSKEVPGGLIAALGMGLLAIGGLGACMNHKRRVSCILAVLLGGALFYSGCTKNETLSAADGKLYIRLVQVDKDGTKTFSKVVTVIKE